MSKASVAQAIEVPLTVPPPPPDEMRALWQRAQAVLAPYRWASRETKLEILRRTLTDVELDTDLVHALHGSHGAPPPPRTADEIYYDSLTGSDGWHRYTRPTPAQPRPRPTTPGGTRMSRSRPHEHLPNPAVRRFEWNGANGTVRYYDRDRKENIEVGPKFQFLLLDQLGSVGGWHKQHDCGIYSNEVKDTRADILIVKHKGGVVAEGLYKAIRDRVTVVGGQFIAVLYIAFKQEAGTLAIGTLQFKGAALHAWAEFAKAHRADLYAKAVKIAGSTEGRKGQVVFRTPNLSLVDVSAETDGIAKDLDAQLQTYLEAYLARTKRDQVDDQVHEEEDGREAPPTDDDIPPLTDDDIPF